MLEQRAKGERVPQRSAGFTVLELLVVLVIVAMMFSIVIPSSSASLDSKARAESYRISVALRYIYNRAVIDGQVYRLVIDLDENSIRTERVEQDGNCGVTLPLDEAANTRFTELLKKAEETRRKKMEEEGAAPTETQFSKFSDFVSMNRSMPSGVVIARAASQSLPETREEGLVYIHAFPSGVIEKAAVVIHAQGSDEPDDTGFTVVTEPYLGRATVIYGKEDPGDMVTK
jgi:prepilin-type N-terminal cleavage/methylation domain-containing protein